MRIWSLIMKHLNVQSGTIAHARRFSLKTKMASVFVDGMMQWDDHFFLSTFIR